MKANVNRRDTVSPKDRIHGLTQRENRLVQLVYEECNRQYQEERERMIGVITATFLHCYMMEGNGVLKTRRFWEALVSRRADLRAELRGIGDPDAPGYELKETGKNIEDTGIMMMLWNSGVDLDAWENAVRMSDDGRVSFADADEWAARWGKRGDPRKYK